MGGGEDLAEGEGEAGAVDADADGDGEGDGEGVGDGRGSGCVARWVEEERGCVASGTASGGS